jgi:dienelactone hydrolase
MRDVMRTSAPLLLVIVTAFSSCSDTTTLPPGRPVLDSEIDSSVESSPTEPPIDAPDTRPEVVSTTLEPTSSSIEPRVGNVSSEAGCVPISVATGSTQVVGERCDPGPFFSGPRPAVLVLNGCGGYDADAEIGRAIATALTREGIVAVRLDYLGAAPAPPTCDDALTGLRASAEPILGAIADTAVQLRLDPTIDPGSVGAVGYSLGALTVMSALFGGAGLSAVEPVPLSAVALLSYPDLLPDVTATLAAGFGPPVFVMAGAADESAPPAGSQAVVDAAFEGGVPVEQLVVPGQGHVWNGPAASLAASVIADELADRLAG